MTNAEIIQAIRNEIESLKSIEYPCDNSQQATGFFNALDRMTDFLSTLESEKPETDLEQEVISYFQGLWPGTDTPEECNTHMHFTPPAIMRLARHFAEWGAEHLKK